MKRQWQINHMADSFVSENFKHSFSTYSNIIIPQRVQSRSKQKIMDKSKDKFYTGYQYLAQKSSLNNYKIPQSTTLKEIPSYEFKENPMRKEIEVVTLRVRELETKHIEYQQRVETLERTSRHTSKLSTSLDEFMRNQYADIKERERFQQRLETFEQALGHMSTIKADRKDLQSVEVGRYYGLTERINELQRQIKRVDTEIQEVNQNFQRFLGKIQTNFALMGEKYEDFIQSNIIKTVDYVNKLTQHYHCQIEQLSKNQNIMSDKMQTIQTAAINELSRYQKKMNFSKEMIGVSLPGLKLVQSIFIKDERRPKAQIHLKQHVKQQPRASTHYAESSSISTVFSDTILNSLYDSLDTLGPNTSMQLSFQKTVYKLDSNFNLLDQNDHYLLNESGQHIRLTERHVALLREHGMIV